MAKPRAPHNPATGASVDELVRIMMLWISVSMRLSRGNESVRAMADVGLTLPQIGALHVLQFAGPRSVSELTEELGLSLSATSHLVQRLVEMGLVLRQEDARDRRQKVLTLSAAGKKMGERLIKSRQQELRISVEHLTQPTRDRLFDILHTVVDELSAALPSAAPHPAGAREPHNPETEDT